MLAYRAMRFLWRVDLRVGERDGAARGGTGVATL